MTNPVLFLARATTTGVGSARNTSTIRPGVEVVTPALHARHTLTFDDSLAVAHISGKVALLLQQAPDLASSQIKIQPRVTAQPVAHPSASTGPVIGLIDARAAALARQP